MLTPADLERMFWVEGAAFYREWLAEECVMVFPGVGLMTRAQVIEGIDRSPRWAEVQFGDEHVIDVGPDSRILCYHATARRQGEPEYAALVSSVYVRRGDGWKLTFHQHTPAP
jgi:hypothetical protein